jgi:7-cyano-7-deazaguanine reductase
VGTIGDSPLGKAAHYFDAYDPSLLYPVERAPLRAALGLSGALPFDGADAWTAWEVSWLDAARKPQVAVAAFDVPCTSPRIVESKSVKLYLTAFNGTRFDDAGAVRDAMASDLSGATGAEVRVELAAPQAWVRREELAGESLDDLPLDLVADAPHADLLRSHRDVARETLVTRLFRSVCPVTGQPDYADVQLRYEGHRIDRGSLLAYLVAFRHHAGFHEHCVERIYVDVLRACHPARLAVCARFTRRGGVDINPWRSNEPGFRPPRTPTSRQ